MSVNNLDVLNIAGYKFEPLDDIEDLVPKFQSICDKLELKVEKYLHFLEQDKRFLDIPLKKNIQ